MINNSGSLWASCVGRTGGADDDNGPSTPHQQQLPCAGRSIPAHRLHEVRGSVPRGRRSAGIWRSAHESINLIRSLSANSHTYYYLVTTHSLFHSTLKTFLFRKSVPLQPVISSSWIFTTWIPRTVYCYFWACLFSTFSFSVFTLFSCRLRAVD